MPITVALSTQRSIATMLQSRRLGMDATAERRLIEFLSLAQKSIDIAAYDLRSAPLMEALKTLAERVKVRIIIDAGTRDRADTPALDPKSATTVAAVKEAGLSSYVTERGHDGTGAMHHKFAVRDGAAIWTGGMNFTDGGFHLEDASAISLESTELAAVYTVRFEQMISGEAASAAPAPTIVVGKGHRVKPLFGSAIKPALLDALRGNAKRVRVIAYAISDDAILDALAALAKGTCDIRGIYDPHGMTRAYNQRPDNTERFWFREDPRFFAALSNRFHPYGEPNALSHKIIAVNDTVFLGSWNFAAGEENIDDDMLCIESQQVAIAVTRYFDAPCRTIPDACAGVSENLERRTLCFA